MPYSRPGYMHYAVAGAAHQHGDPVIYDGVVGQAVKQRAVSAGAAAGAATQQAIASGESFAIISKGVIQIPNTTNGRVGGTGLAAVKGSTVYMTIATMALTLAGPASGTVARFGRVVEIAGQRGTPAGMIRVDLDKKDSLL